MSPLRRFPLALLLALVVFFGDAGWGGVCRADELAAVTDGDVRVGQRLVLRAEVEGGVGPFHFQWFKDHSPIADGMSPELTLDPVRATDAGSYWVTVFNDGGSATSAAEIIKVRAANPSRLANASVVASATEGVRVSFALGGRGTGGVASVLARAAGPALAQFGVVGALRDPVLSVFHQDEVISSNDNWGGDPLLSSTASALGAFPFPTSSKDAAVLLTLARSRYFAEVADATNGRGITVVELYDAASPFDPAAPRLISFSAGGAMNGDDAPLTAGFTIEGDDTIFVLLRALGPALQGRGLTGVVDDPKLRLFRGSTLIASNEDWGDVANAAIVEAQTAVGATPLETASRDAAIVLPLGRGAYTAQLSSGTGPGIALIEVYEVP